jgi:hypothetical protein
MKKAKGFKKGMKKAAKTNALMALMGMGQKLGKKPVKP